MQASLRKISALNAKRGNQLMSESVDAKASSLSRARAPVVPALLL